MAGIDPKTKSFSEPPEVIKKEIEELKTDQSLPAKDKEQIVQALSEALKRAEPIKHRENIELVKKNYERLDAVLQ
jgi:ribosome maturation protein Sdo1